MNLSIILKPILGLILIIIGVYYAINITSLSSISDDLRLSFYAIAVSFSLVGASFLLEMSSDYQLDEIYRDIKDIKTENAQFRNDIDELKRY